MAPCKKNIPPKKEEEVSEKDLEKVAGGVVENAPEEIKPNEVKPPISKFF